MKNFKNVKKYNFFQKKNSIFFSIFLIYTRKTVQKTRKNQKKRKNNEKEFQKARKKYEK